MPPGTNSCGNIFSNLTKFFSSNGTIAVQVIVNSAFEGLFVNSSV
jgi:hypothetical protein